MHTWEKGRSRSRHAKYSLLTCETGLTVKSSESWRKPSHTPTSRWILFLPGDFGIVEKAIDLTRPASRSSDAVATMRVFGSGESIEIVRLLDARSRKSSYSRSKIL